MLCPGLLQSQVAKQWLSSDMSGYSVHTVLRFDYISDVELLHQVAPNCPSETCQAFSLGDGVGLFAFVRREEPILLILLACFCYALHVWIFGFAG